MKENEFWGRNAAVIDNGQPDETREPSLAGCGGHYPVGECPNPLPEEMNFDSEGGAMQPIPVRPLPDTNPKSQYGIKKVPTHSRVPWTAVILEGIVMALGGLKYGPFNWRQNSVAASVYVDAAERHLTLWNAGEDDDDESKVTHLAHVRACCGILIDAIETGNLVDDRPKNEATIRLLKETYNVTNATTRT